VLFDKVNTGGIEEKEELERQMFLFQVFYNFVRPHMSLTLGRGKWKQKRTPAIAAGLTDHV